MALNVIGYPTARPGSGTIGEVDWRLLQYLMGKGKWFEVVSDITLNGFPVTATGTRQLQTGTGDALILGMLARLDAAQNAAAAGTTNGSGKPRTDLLVLRLDLTTTSTTKATAASLNIKAGTPNVVPLNGAPIATKTWGTVWEMAIAQATLADGATSYTNIVSVLPQPRDMIQYNATFLPVPVPSGSPSGTEVKQFNFVIPDPGWPYKVSVPAVINFNEATDGNGHAVVSSYLNGAAFRDNRGDKGLTLPVMLPHSFSTVRTGQTLVEVTISAVSVAGILGPVANFTRCPIIVEPA